MAEWLNVCHRGLSLRTSKSIDHVDTIFFLVYLPDSAERRNVLELVRCQHFGYNTIMIRNSMHCEASNR